MRHFIRPLRAFLGLCALSGPAFAGPIFINEFHYDNSGTDSGEFVEIAGPAATDLGGWRLLLYNGGNGSSYGEVALSGMLGDDTGTGFGFLVVPFASNGLQNGPADGLMLLDPDDGIREFISYEGVLTVAALTSQDVTVSEGAATPLGASLQRSGHGAGPGDMDWQAFLTATPGALNHGQLLVAATLENGAPWPVSALSLLWLARQRRLRR